MVPFLVSTDHKSWAGSLSGHLYPRLSFGDRLRRVLGGLSEQLGPLGALLSSSGLQIRTRAESEQRLCAPECFHCSVVCFANIGEEQVVEESLQLQNFQVRAVGLWATLICSLSQQKQLRGQRKLEVMAFVLMVSWLNAGAEVGT